MIFALVLTLGLSPSLSSAAGPKVVQLPGTSRQNTPSVEKDPDELGAEDWVEICRNSLRRYANSDIAYHNWSERNARFSERKSAKILVRVPKGEEINIHFARGVRALGPFSEPNYHQLVIVGLTSDLLKQKFPSGTEYHILDSAVKMRSLSVKSNGPIPKIKLFAHDSYNEMHDQLTTIRQTVLVEDHAAGQKYYVVPANALRGIPLLQIESWGIHDYELDPNDDLVHQMRELGDKVNKNLADYAYLNLRIVTVPAFGILLSKQNERVPNVEPADDEQVPEVLKQVIHECEQEDCFTDHSIILAAGTPPEEPAFRIPVAAKPRVHRESLSATRAAAKKAADDAEHSVVAAKAERVKAEKAKDAAAKKATDERLAAEKAAADKAAAKQAAAEKRAAAKRAAAERAAAEQAAAQKAAAEKLAAEQAAAAKDAAKKAAADKRAAAKRMAAAQAAAQAAAAQAAAERAAAERAAATQAAAERAALVKKGDFDLTDTAQVVNLLRGVFGTAKAPPVSLKDGLAKIQERLRLTQTQKTQLAGRIYIFDGRQLASSKSARENLSRILQIFAQSVSVELDPTPTSAQLQALMKALSSRFS